MPLTFLAHQGPLLPLTRRWPHAVDGIALMMGTMTPDFAWVLVGTSWEVRSHELPAGVTVCVPLAIVLAWLVVRVLAPVVPDHLPRFGPLRWFDFPSYRGLATHRFGVVRTPLWAVIGTMSHLAIDQFTHDWGWAARNLGWYSDALGDREIAGQPVTPFRVGQWAGNVGLSAMAVGLLLSYARSGWLRSRAASIPVAVTSPISHLVLWGMALLGAVAAAVGSRGDPAWVVVFMRMLGGAFAGMCLGALLVRRANA